MLVSILCGISCSVAIDSTVERRESLTAKNIDSKEDLVRFMNHCCSHRHYSFQIKKCGSDTCMVCKPVRLPSDVFTALHFLPDPVPGVDGHYRSFDEAIGSVTDESHRPSMCTKAKRKKTLPCSASLQHVKNVDLMLQCEECSMWRLLNSKHKLNRTERADLQAT